MKQQIPVSIQTPPVVCTLDDEQRTEQVMEWSDLGGFALTSVRIEGGIASTFPGSMVDQIEDLVSRERSCCGSWLSINVSPMVDDIVRLELTTVNPDGQAMIMAMAGLDS